MRSAPDKGSLRLKVVEGELVKGTPPSFPVKPRLPPVTRLHNLKAIRRDMTKLYRSARTGELDSSELGRFMYAARTLGEMHEKEAVEPRIDALEARINELVGLLQRTGK